MVWLGHLRPHLMEDKGASKKSSWEISFGFLVTQKGAFPNVLHLGEGPNSRMEKVTERQAPCQFVVCISSLLMVQVPASVPFFFLMGSLFIPSLFPLVPAQPPACLLGLSLVITSCYVALILHVRSSWSAGHRCCCNPISQGNH